MRGKRKHLGENVQGRIKGPKMGQIGVYIAQLGPPERPRVPSAQYWSWFAGCRRISWSKKFRSKITVVNVAVLGSFEVSIRIYPNRHFEARLGPRRPCHRSLDLFSISIDDCANVTASKHPSGDSKLRI